MRSAALRTTMATLLFLATERSRVRAFSILRATSGSSHRSVVRPSSSSSSSLFARSSSLNAVDSSSSSSSSSVPKPVPVTLLSGFLGSGKTTALRHVLENKRGLRVGVVVNDVAAVNVDAKLVASTSDHDGAMELRNGCACCSLADELLTSVQRLLEGRRLDAVVVELSGVADPTSVRNHWEEARVRGHPVTSVADLNRVVTVVDSSTFGTDWFSWHRAGDREGWIVDGDGDHDHGGGEDACAADRRVPELLAEQVEAADLLLLNKVDLAGDRRTKSAFAAVRGLNARACVHEATYGRIDPERVVGATKTTKTTTTTTMSSCCDDPTCDKKKKKKTKNTNKVALDAASLGVVDFVYRSDRPFHPVRLSGLLSTWPVPHKDELDLVDRDAFVPPEAVAAGSPFSGVLRSKGFCWIAPSSWDADAWRHDTAMYWSHAGKHFGVSTAGRWWGSVDAARLEEIFRTAPEERERILREDWASEEFGDRRQEVVFIGVDVDEAGVRRELDACLLTDAEMETYRRDLAAFQQQQPS